MQLSGIQFVASKDQVFAELQGESVILNVKTGVYYGLNPLGTRVWQLIQKPVLFNEIRDAILAEYDVEQSRLEADLSALLQDMTNAGLVEVVHEPSA